MCVIVYTKIGNNQILAKNRDRTYRPKISIIHEVVHGLEVVYLRDEITGWVEGINANGEAIVNSTMGRMDGKHPVKALNKKKNVIYQMLTTPAHNGNFYNKIKLKNNYLLEGNTLLVMGEGRVYHIENTNQENLVVEQISVTKTNTRVYSNHGIRLRKGFRTGKKGLSSFLRRKLVQDELKQNPPKNILELADRMNKMESGVDPRFQPYRDKKSTQKRLKNESKYQPIISTTGQIIMDTTNKEFYYFRDKHNSLETKYVNRLPPNWVAQIRVHLLDTEKHKRKTRKKYLSQSGKTYLKNLTDCFEKKPIEVCSKISLK